MGWPKKWPNSIRPPHDVTQILLGTGLLWFGWFGFNGGSQWSVHGAELPFTTTHISAATGLVACRLLKHGVVESPLPLAWQPVPWPDWLASPLELVLSRLELGWRSVQSPDCFAAAQCSSVQLKVSLRFDDSLDTFAVHGVGGTVGAILTGVFASAELISSHPAAQVLAENGRVALIGGQIQAVLDA